MSSGVQILRVNTVSQYVLQFQDSNCPGPEVIKLFSRSTQLSLKCVLLINRKLLTIASSFLLKVADMKISMLINMKMPTTVGIFIFISRETFMLS